MDYKGYLDGLLDTARDSKNHLWEDHQERDMQATVGLLTKDSQMVTVPAELVSKIAQVTHSVPEMLDNLFDGIVDGRAPITMDQIRAIIVIADGYTRTVETSEPPTPDLETLFRDDPKSGVTEAISVYFAERNVTNGCDICMARQAYILAEGGKFQWLDNIIYVIPDDDGPSKLRVENPLADVLRKYLTTEGLA